MKGYAHLNRFCQTIFGNWRLMHVYCRMFLKRLVHLSLVVLLLFADSGVTLYAHTCLKTKHTHFSIGTPKHCCKGTKTKSNCSVTKSSCCNVNSKYIKQDFVYKETEAAQQELPALALIFSTVFSPVILPVEVNSTFSHSPPLLCKADGVFTQTFRI